MKNRLSRQGMLKLLLIAALGAHYAPDFMRSMDLHRSDLSSSEVVGGSTSVDITSAPPPDDSLPPAQTAKVIDKGNANIALEPVGVAATGALGVPAQPNQPPPAGASDNVRMNGNPALGPLSREDIKAGEKACRLNARGEPLSEVQATRCFIDQLSNFYIDDSANWTAHDRAASQIERIVRDNLKIAIKNRLMSHDDAKVDEGEQLLDDAVNAVSNATTEFNLDTYRMSHLVMELKSLKVGGRAFRDATDLESKIRDTQNDLRQQYAEATAYARANPRDTYAQQRLTQEKYEIANRTQLLQTQAQLLTSQGSYSELLGASRAGYISTTDFSQFVQPFQVINSDLTAMRGLVFGPNQQAASSLGAAGLAMSSMPADLVSYRQGLAQNFQSNYGTTVPQNTVSPKLGLSSTGVTTAYNGLPPTSVATQISPNTAFTPVTVVPVN